MMKHKKLFSLLALVSVPLVLWGATIIGYTDWQLRGSSPSNPASGYLRVWADNAGGYFKCLTSAGAACYFDPLATGSTPGLVRPDGSTITVSAGTITAVASALATNTPYSTPVAATSTIPYQGLALWLDASCIAHTDSVTCDAPHAKGTSIDFLADRSGNNFVAYATPTACTFATSQINSKPAVSFNGSCGHYDVTPKTLARNVLMFRSGISIFAAMKVVNNSGTYPLVGSNNTSGIEYRVNTGNPGVLSQGALNMGSGTTTLSLGNWHQINMRCTTTTLGGAGSVQPVFRYDRNSDTPNSGQNCSNWDVGAAWISGVGWAQSVSENFNGYIAELLVYDRYLSSGEVTNVETYFNSKYGL